MTSTMMRAAASSVRLHDVRERKDTDEVGVTNEQFTQCSATRNLP